MLHEGLFPNGALLFQEYTPDYPHVQYTMGYNQMGGPIFYVNLRDNTRVHGPNNYREKKDGDPCFAKIVEGYDVIDRIASMGTEEDESLESAVYILDSQVVNITA